MVEKSEVSSAKSFALQRNPCGKSLMQTRYFGNNFLWNTFYLIEEICELDSRLALNNFDVDSLFTNIPLHETTDICINQLFVKTDTAEGFRESKLSVS